MTTMVIMNSSLPDVSRSKNMVLCRSAIVPTDRLRLPVGPQLFGDILMVENL